jgi:hypothetical protein
MLNLFVSTDIQAENAVEEAVITEKDFSPSYRKRQGQIDRKNRQGKKT